MTKKVERDGYRQPKDQGQERRPQRGKCFKMKSLLMSHSSGMKTATDSTRLYFTPLLAGTSLGRESRYARLD
ncbi:GD24295 [Drosophila simulans]|uniref:GD24295 n=1 Tax=Drosophila simulans TaxID=7240 RepID=B4Q3X2_DROSI|nr:GD24295 [Drosophila simulans]